jgi:hypothetical protein
MSNMDDTRPLKEKYAVLGYAKFYTPGCLEATSFEAAFREVRYTFRAPLYAYSMPLLLSWESTEQP